MRVTTTILALLLVCVGLAMIATGLTGCGDAHLGDAYGRRTKNAFDAQAQAKGGDSAGTLDADDAKITLARQRGRAVPGTPGAAVPGLPSGTTYGTSTYPGAGSTGMTSAGIPAASPTTPIRLDAVR
jgi:hypothetical protein